MKFQKYPLPVAALLERRIKVFFVTHLYDFAHSKPIDRNVKPICYLSQPVNAKRAEARVLKVDSAPAAKPNAGAELVVGDAAKAASDCEPLICVLARVLLSARGNRDNKRESRSDLFGKTGLTD